MIGLSIIVPVLDGGCHTNQYRRVYMDLSRELSQLQELLCFQMNLIQAEIEMNGMVAENKQREVLGQSMAYTEKDFIGLIDKYKIYDNAFPCYKG